MPSMAATATRTQRSKAISSSADSKEYSICCFEGLPRQPFKTILFIIHRFYGVSLLPQEFDDALLPRQMRRPHRHQQGFVPQQPVQRDRPFPITVIEQKVHIRAYFRLVT